MRATVPEGSAARQGWPPATADSRSIAKDYLVRDQVPLNAVVWSDCKGVRPINVNAQVRIDNPLPTQSAQITVDSIDGKIKTILNLSWKHC